MGVNEEKRRGEKKVGMEGWGVGDGRVEILNSLESNRAGRRAGFGTKHGPDQVIWKAAR